ASVDGSDFVNGSYTSGLMFLNNDLENAFLSVPVSIEAEGGQPDILLSESDINFGTVFLEYPQTRELQINNNGRADISFEGVEALNPAISVAFADEAEGIAALDSVMVSITYDPGEVELLDEELIIATDDAGTGDIIIDLLGEAAIAPDIRLNRNLLFAEVEPDQIVSQAMTVRNAGGSTLDYEVDFEETTEGNEGGYPSWILYVDGDGSLEPEEVDELTVRFRGNVEPGDYTADMIITSNDPAGEENRVSLQMTVVTNTSATPENEQPTSFELSQNYPNPFNPTTNISYALPENAHVRLEVFNVQGQRVALLVDQQQNPGNYSATFDASGLSSGVYIYQIQAAGYTKTQKMLLVK
ncbi:MAG: T9SS type A sorting domain-containing protein, partial [Cyclonatronaceae bacterium]